MKQTVLKTLKIIVRTLNILLIIAFVILLIINIHNVITTHLTSKGNIPKIFGYGHQILEADIDEKVHSGDYIIIKAQKNYAVNDIVTYKNKQEFMTQKIIDTTENGYIVKDNTEEILSRDITGKAVVFVPTLGKILKYLRTPVGMLFLVLGGALIFASPKLLFK